MYIPTTKKQSCISKPCIFYEAMSTVLEQNQQTLNH